MAQEHTHCQWRLESDSDYKCVEQPLPESKQGYCIFHEPSKDKDHDAFQERIRQKLDRHDYIFTGYYFPTTILFEKIEFQGKVSFRRAEFVGPQTWFLKARFSGERTDFREARFSGERTSFNDAVFSAKLTDFRNVHFCCNRTDFERARFSGENTYFWSAEFSGVTTSFTEAQFAGQGTYFTGARFSAEKTGFGGAVFSGNYTDFSHARFAGAGTGFQQARFSAENTSFWKTRFSAEDTDFSVAQFVSGRANFQEAEFSGRNTSFYGTRFSNEAIHFRGAKFLSEDTVFRVAQFSSGRTDFRRAKFFGARTDFNAAQFSGPVTYFRDVQFGKGRVDFRFVWFSTQEMEFDWKDKSTEPIPDSIDFSEARLLSPWIDFSGRNLSRWSFKGVRWRAADFTNTKWNGLARRPFVCMDELNALELEKKGRGQESPQTEQKPEDSDDAKGSDLTPTEKKRQAFLAAEAVCRNLKQAYQGTGDYATAGEFFYGEMECARKAEQGKARWLGRTILKAVCGYGERPWRVLLTWGTVVLISTLLYSIGGITAGNATEPIKAEGCLTYLWHCFYMSCVTFTTLGYGDYHPAGGFSQFFAAAEASLGAILMALFLLVVARKFTR